MNSNEIIRNADAEILRQSHCERKGKEHQCIGVVTIDQRGMNLDCKLCGSESESLEASTALIEEAKSICNTIGVDFLSLCPDKRRQMLLELLEKRLY